MRPVTANKLTLQHLHSVRGHSPGLDAAIERVFKSWGDPDDFVERLNDRQAIADAYNAQKADDR